jgi:hypothetical protein
VNQARFRDTHHKDRSVGGADHPGDAVSAIVLNMLYTEFGVEDAKL